LTVGARLVARPATLLAAEFTVGAILVATPAALLPAALIVGAALVAAPVTCVAALLVVAVALELLHAARMGNIPITKAQKRTLFSREPVISRSLVRDPFPAPSLVYARRMPLNASRGPGEPQQHLPLGYRSAFMPLRLYEG
jgi:hypothetical protein